MAHYFPYVLLAFTVFVAACEKKVAPSKTEPIVEKNLFNVVTFTVNGINAKTGTQIISANQSLKIQATIESPDEVLNICHARVVVLVNGKEVTAQTCLGEFSAAGDIFDVLLECSPPKVQGEGFIEIESGENLVLKSPVLIK